ncbi:MAG: hypothetical protein HYX50_03035 [Chloroflexi bacterium]|nr:hypothetical protein [Chloroflexota bacterium]
MPTSDAPLAEAQAAAFYERAVENAETLLAASKMEGLDAEIALLRTRLLQHGEAHPDDLSLLTKAMSELTKMVAARFRMTAPESDALAERGDDVVRQLAAAFGVAPADDV